jgi:hypothetical protein
MLRKARLDQGVSLQDISVRTRISLKNLEAIELDDPGQISSPFIYRSFVRQFANELNFDFGVLAPGVLAACDTMRQPLLPGESDAPVVRVAPIRPKIRRDFHWLYSAGILVLIIAAASGAYALWTRANPQTVATEIPSPASAFSSLAVRLGFTALVHSNANLATAAPSSTPVVVPPIVSESDNGIHLQLSAIETTWLSIVADGKQTYSGILKTSQTKVLVGRETARIRTGNAGGLTVVFNGKELGPLGRRGETRTVLFTTTGYEVVRSVAGDLIPTLFEVPISRTGE